VQKTGKKKKRKGSKVKKTTPEVLARLLKEKKRVLFPPEWEVVRNTFSPGQEHLNKLFLSTLSMAHQGRIPTGCMESPSSTPRAIAS
jgi:hypothetical protein